jgi:hypothetical protein
MPSPAVRRPNLAARAAHHIALHCGIGNASRRSNASRLARARHDNGAFAAAGKQRKRQGQAADKAETLPRLGGEQREKYSVYVFHAGNLAKSMPEKARCLPKPGLARACVPRAFPQAGIAVKGQKAGKTSS